MEGIIFFSDFICLKISCYSAYVVKATVGQKSTIFFLSYMHGRILLEGRWYAGVAGFQISLAQAQIRNEPYVTNHDRFDLWNNVQPWSISSAFVEEKILLQAINCCLNERWLIHNKISLCESIDMPSVGIFTWWYIWHWFVFNSNDSIQTKIRRAKFNCYVIHSVYIFSTVLLTEVVNLRF